MSALAIHPLNANTDAETTRRATWLTADWFSRKGFAVVTGLTLPNESKADLVAVNVRRQVITIIEIKASMYDLHRDVEANKWRAYLPFCDRMAFALPSNLVAEACDILSDHVGVYSLSNDDLAIVRQPKSRILERGMYPQVVGLMLLQATKQQPFDVDINAIPDSGLVQMIDTCAGIHPRNNQYAPVKTLATIHTESGVPYSEYLTHPVLCADSNARMLNVISEPDNLAHRPRTHKGRPPRFEVTSASNRRAAPVNRADWGDLLDDDAFFKRACSTYDHLVDVSRSIGRTTFRQLQESSAYTNNGQVVDFLDALQSIRWITQHTEEKDGKVKTFIEVLTIPPPTEFDRHPRLVSKDQRLSFPQQYAFLGLLWQELYVALRPTLSGTHIPSKTGMSDLAALFREVLDEDRIALAMESFLREAVIMPDGTHVPLPVRSWPKFQRFGPTIRTFVTHYDQIVALIEEAAGEWARSRGEEVPTQYLRNHGEQVMANLRHSYRLEMKRQREARRLKD
jgi:hypothetical protein